MSVTPTRDRVNPEKIDTTPKRRPQWLRVRAPVGETQGEIRNLMRSSELHTVCAILHSAIILGLRISSPCCNQTILPIVIYLYDHTGWIQKI